MNFNKDIEKVKRIINALGKMQEKYGEYYCPCVIEHDEDTICPCNNFRKHGKCECGLFEDDSI